MDATTDKTHGNPIPSMAASKTSLWCAATAATSPMRRCRTRPMPISCARRMPSPASSASTRRGAVNAPGVVAVLTAKDMEGVGNVARHPPVAGRDGGKLIMLASAGARRRTRHAYRRSRSRWWSRRQRADRAGRRRIRPVEYEELTPVVDARDALQTARRRSGRRRPAISRSTGPGRSADPRRQCRGGRAHFRFGQTCRAHGAR